MSQSYSSNCFSTANVIETDMQNVKNNFDALRSLFSGSSSPTSPDAGQLWYDTGSSSVKIRYNSSWVEWWDMDGQCVAAGQVKTASLAAGALTADAAGRGKMADGYITTAKVSDVDGSKINANSVTPSKLAPGASTLVSWHSISSMDGTPLPYLDGDASAPSAFTLLSNLNRDGSTYKKIMGFYVYIPTGAKYLVLGIRGSAPTGTLYVRINVNGTSGGAASVGGSTITNGASGAALDVSALAGAWRYLYIEAVLSSASSVARLQSLVVQWYGA